METSGPESEVVKLLPPLTITPEELDEGLRIARPRRPRDRLTATVHGHRRQHRRERHDSP